MSDNIAQERALELAQRDTELIAQLLDSKPFVDYYLRRLRERRQQIRDLIADDASLTEQETHTLRKLVKEYDALISLPQQDRGAHRSTIESAKHRTAGPSRG